jgi:hypothetical protein
VSPPTGSRRAVIATAGTVLVLGVAFLLAPPMGTDLSAQQARADFARHYGTAPVDLRWYGGTVQYGYSLFSQFLMAALTPRLVGTLAAVVSALALTYLLIRAGAARPVLGGILGAVLAIGNLASGRITFALGLAFGTLALATLAGPLPADRLSSGRGRLPGGWWALRLVSAGVLAALATWASPVAGLFVGLVGAAMILAAPTTPRTLRAGIALCAGAVVALLPMTLFGDGGKQLYTAESMRINVAIALAVVFLVPARYRVVRTGAGLTVLLLVAAYYVPSPIGFNAARLPMLYAIPVLAALAAVDWRWLTAVLLVLVWWQPPVVVSDLTHAGSAESRSGFYRPLASELAQLGPIGRIEVVPLREHWESSYVGSAVPLARGWERQVDVARNPLFYTATLSAGDYLDWLRRNAVSYVAVAPDSQPDRYALTEAAVVDSGQSYLREVWRDAHWRLYAVADPAPLVSAPGRLVSSAADRVVFDAAAPGTVLVRIRWTRWLSTAGGCAYPGPDGWTSVRVPAAGRYTVSSAVTSGASCTGS